MIIIKLTFAWLNLYLLAFDYLEHRLFHDNRKFLNLLLSQYKQTNTYLYIDT